MQNKLEEKLAASPDREQRRRKSQSLSMFCSSCKLVMKTEVCGVCSCDRILGLPHLLNASIPMLLLSDLTDNNANIISKLRNTASVSELSSIFKH